MNQNTANFAYLWEYIVKDHHLEQFCSVYGPQGEWVQLFSRSNEYVKTELHRDLDNPNRLLTIDYWVSREGRNRFREQHASEFAALDKACDTLTVEERFIGDFEFIGETTRE
jgi:hypothetical protein